jgi:hypothetical protein
MTSRWFGLIAALPLAVAVVVIVVSPMLLESPKQREAFRRMAPEQRPGRRGGDGRSRAFADVSGERIVGPL